MLAGVVRQVVELGAARGLTRERLLAELGLRAEELEDPDGLVPFEAYVRAWEVIGREPGNEDVGLQLGAPHSLEALGALGYAMIHAETGVAAIELFRRHARLVSESLAPHIDLDREHVTYHLVWPTRLARVAACADAALAGPISLLRALLGLPIQVPLAAEAWYQCPRPAGVDRAQALGCPVRYDAPEMRLVMYRAPLEQPLPRHDPKLFQYLSRHAQAVLARLPQSARISERVQRLILETLQDGEPAQAEIARKLAISERTLQRRLREEGTSFADLLDRTRHELALRYLEKRYSAGIKVAEL